MTTTSTWIDLVNANNDIHKHLNESFINERIQIDNTSYLNWMNIFNSKIPLSNEFIIKYINYIDWKYLTRTLDEPMLERYYHLVINWNVQLYGQTRTIDFITKFQKKFNWTHIAMNPPAWFNETHFLIFNLRPRRVYRPAKKVVMHIQTIELSVGSINNTPDNWVGILSMSN